MMGKFDITAAFQAAVGAAGNVSKSDTSRETIEYIGLNKLEADPGNFYSLAGLENLAANIELCGLQQPIRVRPTEDGRFRPPAMVGTQAPAQHRGERGPMGKHPLHCGAGRSIPGAPRAAADHGQQRYPETITGGGIQAGPAGGAAALSAQRAGL